MASSLFVKKLSSKATLPKKGSELAAGWDLAAAEAAVVPARGKALVKTDLAIATPVDTYARIAPRSGLAWKKSIDVGAGVVDADYRGNVGVILFNFSDEPFQVDVGDRIAQLILEKIDLDAQLVQVDELPNTTRGDDGFGSTGVADDAPDTTKELPDQPPLAKKPRPISPDPDAYEHLSKQYSDLQAQFNKLKDRLDAIDDNNLKSQSQ